MNAQKLTQGPVPEVDLDRTWRLLEACVRHGRKAQARRWFARYCELHGQRRQARQRDGA